MVNEPRVMLAVGSYDRQGGTNTFVRNLSKNLSEKGIFTLVMSHKLIGDKEKNREINKNLVVRYFPAFPRKRYFFPLYFLRFFLMSLYIIPIVLKNKINIILTGETEALPFFLTKIFGVKIIIRGANPFPGVTKKEFGRKKRALNTLVFWLIDFYEKFILAMCDDIVILAEWERDILKNYTEKDMNVIRYAVDTNKFSPKKKKNNKNLVYCGRISYSKNIDKLIECFDLVRQKVKGIKLVLVGQLEDYDSIKEFTKKSKFEKDIIYLGEKKADEIPLILQKNYIFTHTAFDLGNAPLEAASTGLPVVVLGTKFDDNYVLKEKTERDFADEIIRLIRNKGHYKKISLFNRIYVIENHSWKAITNQYIKIFSKIVK